MSDENSLHDGNAAAMGRFFTWATEKGELPAPRVNNMRTAVNRILAVEEEPERVDIRSLNVEDLLERFEIKNKARYNLDSMATYKSRFRVAIDTYRSFLEGGTEWRAIGRGATARPTAKKALKRIVKQTKPAALGSAPSSPDETSPKRSGASGSDMPRMISYDYPLRKELVVRLALPVDLTPSDARRLAAFIQSLAFTPDGAGTEAGAASE